ncbi:MAG TPA: hypothetical protein VMS77_05485 [Conexivisphaerales archaeon]|nr:hypothetical protein [Conexivisphaerales archaeon]
MEKTELGSDRDQGDKEKVLSRRKLLAIGAAAAAGLALAPSIKETKAATGDFLVLGKENWTDTPDQTVLHTDCEGNPTPGEPSYPGFQVIDSGEKGVAITGHANWTGVRGSSAQFGVVGECYGGGPPGAGVMGVTTDGIGVNGTSANGIGVYALSWDGTALKVDGKSSFLASATGDSPATLRVDNVADFVPQGQPQPTAVLGVTQHGFGVHGMSSDGWAVIGHSDTGCGVKGQTGTGIALFGLSGPEGFALGVKGRSGFQTVGSGTIPKLKKSVTLNLAPGLISSNSHVSVMLTSDPNALLEDAAVSYVDRDPVNNKLTINLTKATGKDTSFTYFIVEPWTS